MAALPATQTAPFGAITLYRAVSALESLVTPLVRWNAARRTEKVLSGLSDRQLNDIGLVRGDIARISADMLSYR